MDVALPLAATLVDSSLSPTKANKAYGSLSGSNTSTKRFKIFYRIPIPRTSSVVINTKCHISFRWET
jgi:hypothetical protein